MWSREFQRVWGVTHHHNLKPAVCIIDKRKNSDTLKSPTFVPNENNEQTKLNLMGIEENEGK